MSLFKEFNPISKQEWIDKINHDLKGKDFNETLTWKSDEGIIVEPIYHRESLKGNLSTHFHFPTTSNWIITESITISSIQEANQKALIALKGGASSIQFIGTVKNANEMQELLSGIMIEIIHVHFYTPSPLLTAQLFNQEINGRNLKPEQMKGSITFDFYGNLLTTGQWVNSEKEDLDQLLKLTNETPFKHHIAVNGLNYCHAGASITQELAYSLAQAVEYIDQLSNNGMDAQNAAQKMVFNLGIGSNYFFEIAKLRAFRILWNLVTETFGFENTPVTINSQSSNYNLATQDPQTNILRATTEAMSAIIGGCNSLSLTPYNAAYEAPSNFTSRVARNIQIILKEEAFLDQVNDMAKGAYYIESITDQLVEKSLTLFKEIEANGGYLANLKNGTIQQQVKEISQQKEQAYIHKKRTLLGVNKHINKDAAIHSPIQHPHILHPIIETLPPINLSQRISNAIAADV